MKGGGNVRIVKGQAGAAEAKGGSPSLREAKSALSRYFASNATRSQLPPEAVARLDGIRSSGNAMLESIRPYKDASVFNLHFAEKLAADKGPRGKPEEAAELSSSASGAIRDALDLAAQGLMKRILSDFPAKDADLETTCAISALMFLGAAARYCPDLIFEDSGGVEAGLAEKFIWFYDKALLPLMEPGKKFENARELHGLAYGAYADFKKQMPELFDALRKKLWTSRGELMAPFGSDAYSSSWAAYHYAGKL